VRVPAAQLGDRLAAPGRRLAGLLWYPFPRWVSPSLVPLRESRGHKPQSPAVTPAVGQLRLPAAPRPLPFASRSRTATPGLSPLSPESLWVRAGSGRQCHRCLPGRAAGGDSLKGRQVLAASRQRPESEQPPRNNALGAPSRAGRWCLRPAQGGSPVTAASLLLLVQVPGSCSAGSAACPDGSCFSLPVPR